MKRIWFLLILLWPIGKAEVAGAELRFPPFLPEYYRAGLASSDRPLAFVNQRETNGVTQFAYSIGPNEMLSLEHFAGEALACRTAFNNIVGHVNGMITTNKGAFVEISETEIHAQVRLTNVSQNVFVFMLPHGVNIWTHSVLPTSQRQLRLDFQKLLALSNRQRYEDALREGNVSLGAWQKGIHSHARDLLKEGKKSEGLVVLQNLLATSPFDYEAHFELMENTADSQAATNSAKAVFKNAENAEQVSRAAKFLGAKPPDQGAIPLLSSDDTGLQVILIPLEPCNPWLLEEAAKVYERITDVPVKIRRLDAEWAWGTPERMARQRDVERILVQLKKQNIDFRNWDRGRYLGALTNALESENALSKYQGRDLLAKINAEPGQYRTGPYVDKLSRLIAPHQSKDARTMYVGITEANIYGDDDNFVFSVSTFAPESHAGVMSYYMMQGRVMNSFESRTRLVERIAKELVPASLKQLRIPRSSDPACPYSYSSGVERLDQKTLNLSDEVKEALKKLREEKQN